MDDPNNSLVDSEKKEAEAGSDERLKELEAQVEVLTHNWKRALADYQNLQKRVEKERPAWVESAKISLWLKLLNLLDDLEKAAAHLHDEGLSFIVTHLKNILAEENLVEIEAKVGDQFDPTIHECLELVKGEGEGQIAEVVARGYIIGERVVRPVKVKVYKKETGDLPPLAEKEMGAGDYV